MVYHLNFLLKLKPLHKKLILDYRRNYIVDICGYVNFTIDPKDAKDFDDALSFKKLENGNYEIGIHIADVSYYLEEGTILDDEAYQRATSVYLVDRVVPMLPEVLSNFVHCVHNEEKYTFRPYLKLQKVKVVNQWFGRTVIYSDQRFAYEEAQYIIETKEDVIPGNFDTGASYQVSAEIVAATLKMDELARF
jgi:ribonuclease R